MNCPECGIEMLQLSGWDFLHCVCFNPVHDLPVHVNQTWCHQPHVEARVLTEHEQKIINDRKKDLMDGLKVVKTNWELVGQIFCFRDGSYDPAVKARIAALKEQKNSASIKTLFSHGKS